MTVRTIAVSLLSLTITTIFGTVALAGDGAVRHTAARHVANSYIVVLRDDVDPDAVGAELASKHAVKISHTVRVLLKAFEITATENQAKAISADPRVRYVEDNAIGAGNGDQTPVLSWGLDRIDQVSVQLNNHYLYGYTGQGVTAYVLDSGINQTTELAGRVAREVNFVTVNGVRNPNDTADCYGHGTQVADILGGTIYGVAKSVTFVNVRTLDCTNFTNLTDYVNALDWIVSDYQTHTAPAVINASLNFIGGSQTVDEAVMRALNAGITYVGSAGNEAADACGSSPSRLGLPVNYSPNPNQYSTLTVSGTTMNDSFFSALNYGQCVSILAPGQNIFTLDKNGNLAYFGYTSSAAPFVSGVAALHLERFPSATPSVIGAYIKSNGTANVITGLPAGTPNLLLYNSIYERRHACCVY